MLRYNPYPGRGIMIGCSQDGKRIVVIYFIMGRSENSRNRIFERTNDGIRTAPYDPAKTTDPSLIIYHPVRIRDGWTIVTNGDQTDTISEYLAKGLDFYSALKTREFEPDAPNYTPRISGLTEPTGGYSLSIIKTMEDDPTRCLRCFYEYSKAIPGRGHFISTYKTDGDPLPSFADEPVAVYITGKDGIESFAGDVWRALNDENKVSLYAREQDIQTGKSNDFIINKHI